MPRFAGFVSHVAHAVLLAFGRQRSFTQSANIIPKRHIHPQHPPGAPVFFTGLRAVHPLGNIEFSLVNFRASHNRNLTGCATWRMQSCLRLVDNDLLPGARTLSPSAISTATPTRSARFLNSTASCSSHLGNIEFSLVNFRASHNRNLTGCATWRMQSCLRLVDNDLLPGARTLSPSAISTRSTYSERQIS